MLNSPHSKREITMSNRNMLTAMVFCVCSSTVFATDVINQDNKAYTVKVQGEGKLGVSTHKINANGSMYGLCGYSFCSFEIPGHRSWPTKMDA
jgi:hypothetical protein